MGEIILFANNKIFEPLLHRLEVRAGELDSKRNLSFWFLFFLQVMLTLIAGYLLVALLSFLAAIVPPFFDSWLEGASPTWKQILQDTAHTVHYLFAWSPFLLTIIVSCAKVRTSYREAKASSESEIQALNQVKDEIKTANEKFPEMLVSSLEKVADHGPIKTIVEALNPTNEQLQSVIRQVTEDTVSRMSLLRNVLLLPERARKSLESITDLSRKRVGSSEDDDAPHWSDLYISFAITMQMEPWQSAFKDAKFVFVRDIEELRCFHADLNRLRDAFQEQLHKDFIEMLNLVNGRLMSVMYRDISAWRDHRYYAENAKLLDRKMRNNSEAGLQRLFAIDDDWKSVPEDTVNENLVSAIMGAIWHDEKKYDSRFVPVRAAGSWLVPEDESFLASCVLNDTVIAMHARYEQPPPGKTDREFERYIYKCDSSKRFVEDYGFAFSAAWRASESQTAAQFIEACKASHPKAFEAACQKYSLIHGQPKPNNDPPSTAGKRPKGSANRPPKGK